jgi:hypothetical protein
MPIVFSDLLIKDAYFLLFFCIFAMFWRIVSKSGAWPSQAEVIRLFVSKATAGVVTNHSFASANRPSVQGDLSLIGRYLLIRFVGDLPFSCPSGLIVWFSAKLSPAGDLSLPAGKHIGTLTYYQTTVNKKMTKKALYKHINNAVLHAVEDRNCFDGKCGF